MKNTIIAIMAVLALFGCAAPEHPPQQTLNVTNTTIPIATNDSNQTMIESKIINVTGITTSPTPRPHMQGDPFILAIKNISGTLYYVVLVQQDDGEYQYTELDSTKYKLSETDGLLMIKDNVLYVPKNRTEVRIN